MENIKENNIISKHINIIEHTNENVIRNEFWDNINISISILMRETISGIIKMLEIHDMLILINVCIILSIKFNHDINNALVLRGNLQETILFPMKNRAFL